jgi:hypothetical protein
VKPLKFSMKHVYLNTFLAWHPKARRRHLRCRCHRQPPDRGPDHHYYHFSPPAGASSVSAVEAGLTVVEAVASSMPVVFSSRTFSSSESLRMMILSSLGGPRTARLSSSKSIWVN